MDNVKDIIVRLRSMKARVWVEDDNLNIDIEKGMIDDQLKELIRTNKHNLIKYIADAHGRETRNIPLLSPQPDYETSSSQRRLWLLSQFEGGNAAYNVADVYAFKGRLDYNALEYSFRSLIQRHEILRTTFRENEEGNIRQVISKAGETGFHITHVDLREETDVDATLKNLIREEGNRPFDLYKGPLVRATLYQLTHNNWVFAYTLHHIICDGWSMEIFIRELLTFYNSYIGQVPLTLPPLRIQYKDYAAWQQEALRKPAQVNDGAYWIRQFQGTLPVLDLPTDKPRPPIRSYSGGKIGNRLSLGLADSLLSFCDEKDCTLFMVMQAVLNVLLFKYTGQQDIIIGSPIAGREHVDLEEQIGFYVNTLALRNQFNGEDDFLTILEKVRITTMDAYEHQLYPFDELVANIDLKRTLNRHPLFDVVLDVKTLGKKSESSSGNELDELSVGRFNNGEYTVSKFDLMFSITAADREFFASLEYNEIYSYAFARQLLTHLEQLLAVLLTSPTVPVKELEFLTDTERERLITDGTVNATYPAELTLVDLFETQVTLTPANIAVVFEDKQLTYKELNERANQLGAYLRDRHNIHAGDLVGILQERSEQMIVSILGVLKSGAAYVPLDPAYPQDRIAYMLSDSQCRVVLDAEALKRFEEVRSSYQTANLSHVTRPEDVAYVIYTSGSTGRPKGVMIEHRNVVRLLKTDRPLFDFNGDDVWTMFHSFCFDFSVWEMYGALLNGGRLVQVPAMTARDPEQFISLLIREGVTVLNQTPGSFYNIISQEQERSSRELNLRYVIFGGEALQPRRLAHWYTRYPDVKLINMYGITETTVHVTYKEIGEKEISADISNIGKPIPTLSCYVLDQEQHLLPAGVYGELYVGGAGVGRGYLNNDTLTAARFIPDPFVPGGRLYRTGDRVRLLSNGEMEYGGRLDDQVKIRGYRIELGEISAALDSHGEINRSVVIIKTDAQGDKQLIAYVTGSRNLNTEELRQWLQTKLPDYMLPACYVQLESIPLTVNGKVDKNQLPDPGISTSDVYRAARNEKESRLVTIWSSVLGIEASGISIDSNFFELGGHSLKATSLLSRVHKELGIRLPLSSLFSDPTIAGMSAQLGFEDSYESIPLAPVQPVYALSAAQRRMYILHQLNRENTGYNMPMQLWLPSSATEERLASVFTVLINRHESLRTSFEMAGEEPVQRIHEHVDFKLSVFESSDEALLKLQQSFVQPFDLSIAPLLRVAYVKLPGDRRCLLIDMHHIITDGISQMLLEREFSLLYEGHPLPPVRLQYKDYSEWQRSDVQQQRLSVQGKWWHDIYKGSLPVLSLPYDYVRPQKKLFKGQRTGFNIDGETYTTLQRYCREEQVTPYMYLLSVVSIWLSRLGGEEDIIVGSPVSGRRHADVERVTGLFVNTLALRTQPSPEKHFREYLQEVRAHVLGAQEHQEYGFEELVDHLQVQRELNRNPVFDVMFSYQPPRKTVQVSQETVTGEALLHTPCQEKFDLTLSAEEYEESIRLILSYDTGLFASSTIDRFISYLHHLLTLLGKEGDTTIGELDMLPENERHRLVYENNATAAPYPADKTLVELFESQVQLTPRNVAVVFEDKQHTYAGLNELSNQLGAYLRDRYGVKPGDRVGILQDRSEQIVVAILGVLKSGAAYVPLDPAYPQERIDYMSSDSDCRVVLDDIVLQHFYEVRAEYQTGDLTHTSQPDDLLYVIYTSGSTGKPKGVMVTHTTMVNYITWFTGTFGINAGDSTLFLSSFTFDGVKTSLFGALLSGGTLHVISNELVKAPQKLAAYINRNDISFIKITPAHFSLLVNDEESLELVTATSGLRLIVMGGESLNADHVKKFYEKSAHTVIVNHYGPTETTVAATAQPVERAVDSLSIGYPISNAAVYILDDNQRPVPTGVKGEIFIGGKGITKGYLNQPELTAKKFVSNPFRPGELMYMTGDLGRWLPAGNIEFFGRKDDQVKIRSYRVELGEIEHVLRQYDKISGAVVTARDDSDYGKYLVAYYLSRTDLDTHELRGYLQQFLPVYMLPSFFVRLETFPLTNNGKVDKRLLPAPGETTKVASGSYVLPRNETDRQLIAIWSELLHLPEDVIGIDNNFFQTGGHSLSAFSLVNRINKLKSRQFALTVIYQYQTIRELADYIDRIDAGERQEEHWGELLMRMNQGMDRKVFYFPSIVGDPMDLLNMLSEIRQATIYGFRFTNDADLPEKYMEQITALQNEGPYVLIGYSAGGNMAFNIAGLLQHAGRTVTDIIMLDAYPKDEPGVSGIASIAEELKQAGVFNDLENIYESITGYSSYYNDLIIQGKTNARLHIIKAEGIPDEAFQKWSAYTYGGLFLYDGKGHHWEMGRGDAGHYNQQLLNKILTETIRSDNDL